jgi:hypothetical protein
MVLPVMLTGRRTAAGVAAYFDLITDEGRLFYGDSFHFGYFRTGTETLAQALDAHTDLVAEMARPRAQMDRIPKILARYATFPVLSMLK